MLLHATSQRFGWAGELPIALQITLTLAPSSSQHQDPTYTYLLSPTLSDGWSHHPQQRCPPLLQITVNSCTSVTSCLWADRVSHRLLVQANICQARRCTEVLDLFCMPGTAPVCASLHGGFAGLQRQLCVCFCLTASLVPLWILCHAHRVKTTPVLYNLQTRLNGFLGLANSNCFAEG